MLRKRYKVFAVFAFRTSLVRRLTQNSRKVHAIFTHKTLKLCYTWGTASCCAVSDFVSLTNPQMSPIMSLINLYR